VAGGPWRKPQAKPIRSEQSEGEVFTPHRITAGLGGLIGVCLLFVGLIGAVNAGKAARA